MNSQEITNIHDGIYFPTIYMMSFSRTKMVKKGQNITMEISHLRYCPIYSSVLSNSSNLTASSDLIDSADENYKYSNVDKSNPIVIICVAWWPYRKIKIIS